MIFDAAPEAGYSNALQFPVSLKATRKKKNYGEIPRDEEANIHDDGFAPGLTHQLERLAQGFSQTWKVAVGQQWKRPNLSTRERAILAIAADVVNQTFAQPFRYHVHAAQLSGASQVQIQHTIGFLAEFGAKVWQALSHLQHITQ